MNSNAQSPWRQRYEQFAASYEELLSLDPFADWERNSSPELSAEDELRCGLEAWLGGNRDQGVLFIERAVRIADRALIEKELDAGLCKAGFPRNRGELLRIKAYCVGLLEGRLDREALVSASEDLGVMVRRYSHWDSQTEAYYLAVVRAALIANDILRARVLLRGARGFSWHKEEAQALSKLVSDSVDDKAEGISQLDRLLERVKDPDYGPEYFFEASIARLELAAISEAVHTGHALFDLKPALARIGAHTAVSQNKLEVE